MKLTCPMTFLSLPRLQKLGLLLLLALHCPHALHPSGKHRNIEAPHPHDLCFLCYQLVLFSLPSVCFVTFVVQARVLPPSVSKVLFLLLVKHLSDRGLLSPACSIFFG